MNGNSPSWSVVATVDEPPALVQAFVAWHLFLGADQIYLYFDNPDDPGLPLLDHLAQVISTPCDDAHWMRLGKSRPRRHQVRQVRNARDAYAKCKSDWLVHIDADEYLWPQTSVKDALGGVDDLAEAAIVPVAERIVLADVCSTIFAGAFRRPFPGRPKQGEALFGPDYALTSRGLTGHALGKAFVPCGRDLQMSIHRPSHADRSHTLETTRLSATTMELLHFDGLTPQHWVYKLMRMSKALVHNNGMPPSPHRRRQADALLSDPAKALALYDRVKRADVARLKEHGLLATPEFDPTDALARFFPSQDVDLAEGAVDQWLLHEKSAVLSFLGQ